MVTMISKVRLIVPLGLTQAPAHIVEQWARNLKGNVDIMEQKRKARIPDEMAYKVRLAGPAAQAYAPYPDASFRSRSGKGRNAIVRAQAKNIADSFENYDTHMEHAMESVDEEQGKRFKESVDVSKDLYSTKMAGRSLPFTGEKTIGKSVSGIAPLWLTNDPTTLGYLREADKILAGGPVNVAKIPPVSLVDLRTDLKTALAQRLTKGGVVIVKADFDVAVMAEENDTINAVIKGLQDSITYSSFVTGGDSHCDYVLIDGLMYLEIQVSTL